MEVKEELKEGGAKRAGLSVEGGAHSASLPREDEYRRTIQQDIELAEQDLDPSEEHLRQQFIVVRILIYLMVVIDILCIAFIFPARWYVELSGLLFLVVCFLGLRGTYREDPTYLNYFWKAIYIWVIGYTLGFVIFLAAFGVEHLAKERCTSDAFVLGYCGGCEGNTDSEKLPCCLQICLQEVRSSLNVEFISLMFCIDLVMIALANQGRSLSHHLQYSPMKKNLRNLRLSEAVTRFDAKKLRKKQEEGARKTLASMKKGGRTKKLSSAGSSALSGSAALGDGSMHRTMSRAKAD